MPRTGTFRFFARCVHLTYKTWLSDDQVNTIVNKPEKPFDQISYCHENGHGDTPYEHTHLLIRWVEPFETCDQRYFDIGDIHPNIKVVDLRYKRQFENTLRYHQKEGIFYKQEPEWEDNEDRNKFLSTVQDAEEKNMLDYVLNNGNKWGDIIGMEKFHKLVQKRKRTRAVKEFTASDFKYPGFNDKHVYLMGPKGCGKTEWAKTWFENPLIVRSADELKAFEENFHDGIIFDDCRFGHWPESSIQSLLEWDNPAEVHARYENAYIPRHTRKVFTSNYPPEEVFGEQNWFSPAGQIRCRMTKIVKVNSCLFTPEAAETRGLNINGRAEPKVYELE